MPVCRLTEALHFSFNPFGKQKANLANISAGANSEVAHPGQRNGYVCSGRMGCQQHYWENRSSRRWQPSAIGWTGTTNIPMIIVMGCINRRLAVVGPILNWQASRCHTSAFDMVISSVLMDVILYGEQVAALRRRQRWWRRWPWWKKAKMWLMGWKILSRLGFPLVENVDDGCCHMYARYDVGGNFPIDGWWSIVRKNMWDVILIRIHM